jgi:hypothetical protein
MPARPTSGSFSGLGRFFSDDLSLTKMSDNFGSGVSRVLDPEASAFAQVVWQAYKPPLDSELNLVQQVSAENGRLAVLRGVPSGFLGNETNPSEDYVTNPSWSNWFRLGRQRTGEKKAFLWAAVNGWLVPVAGTRTGSPPGSPNDVDAWNRIALDPPPANAGDARVDFVFLEVWKARVASGPSAVNKPSATALYRYGNVEGGASYLPDDLKDPAIGTETAQRVQVQYRIRVVKGLIGLATAADGFDATVVRGRGGAAADTSFTFSNMRQELGDPGLWRAGDGNASNTLGTVDGYAYAVPLCAVFRRNGVAWAGDPSVNLNGAFNRNPTAVDRTGIKTFSTVPTLASLMNATQTTLTLASATNVPLPASPATPVLIQIGDEVLSYTSLSGATVSGLTRGVLGTVAEAHPALATVKVLSGRPDGLFADQVAKTDVLDLRHVVNPNGLDYDALLRANVDRLVRGRLRSTWKRTNAGPQGSFVFYQDKISSAAAALGVTKGDAPDGHRTTFSDASVQERVEVIVTPFPSAVTSGSQSVGTSWSLAVNASTTRQRVAGQWSGETTTGALDGDRIVLPVAQFKTTLPGSDADQVRFLNDGLAGAVTIRVDGSETPLDPSRYVVTPPSPGPTDDLVIEFRGTGSPLSTPRNLYLTVNLLYGPGRGISRRPDSVHSVTLASPSAELNTHPATNPANHYPLRAAWAPLWSKYRSGVYKGLLPVTAEAYVDPGSKTVVLTPFRRVAFPGALRVLDGAAINAPSQGLMPANKPDGSAKWGSTDPLNLFSGSSAPDASTNNLYVTLPRHLVPGWGAVHAPILPGNRNAFHRGVNFGLLSQMTPASTTYSDAAHNINYINYDATAPLSFASFSTGNFSGSTTVPATYNATFAFSGLTHAGARFFADGRGLNRKGIELPPFYGIARLWAVYESADYKANGSAFNASTREPTGGGAKNLLRQNFNGPTFWIEIDDDGDSTCVLNAEALDLSKSATPITSFESRHYVVEANVFGFDRGSFDLTKPFRLLLSRARPTGSANSPSPAARSTNVGAAIVGPAAVLPGPLTSSDTALVHYSRTPYQGDPWGSQSAYQDLPHVPGPLTSAAAYQLVSSRLDGANLTRPNQKALEVLASLGFVTTLGTGRLSGDLASPTAFDIRNVGYEDPASYPPSSAIQARPKGFVGALGATEGDVDGEYLGCTERLPLGSLRRDKDFRGGRFTNPGGGAEAFVYVRSEGVGGFVPSITRTKRFEQDELAIFPASASTGTPGEAIVHVDGETGNYAQLTNFRVLRGGSAFAAGGPHPGGELYANYGEIQAPLGHTNVLAGRAYLVRNTVTNVGSSELSAGDELMLLVATTAYEIASGGEAIMVLGTNGTGEGVSAADLYRIEGHPLMNHHARFDVEPADIVLSNRTDAGVL